MKKNTPARLPASSAALVAAMLACSSSLVAATFTWDGGDAASNGWAAANNWNPNGVPVFDNQADLIFNVLTRPGNAITTARTVRSISFGADMDGAFGINLSQFAGSGTAQSLTFDTDSVAGNALISVDAGATGALTIGVPTAGSGSGNVILADNLTVDHAGSGLLLFNRNITGTGFGVTKTGGGTMETTNINNFTGSIAVNGGRWRMSANDTGGDLNNASSISLGGGTIEIVTDTALNKTFTKDFNVTAASGFAYNNTNGTNQTLTIGTGALSLGADLTVTNLSPLSQNNIINITRNLTGNGNIVVDTPLDVASASTSFIPGRVQLSGDNSAWTGDLVVSKGTAQLSGANSLGAASEIVLGTTASAFGAGLGFNSATDVAFANNIVVNSGGFRAIKNNGAGTPNVTLSGDVTLNGTLSIAATMDSGKIWTMSGDISGAGGLALSGNAGTHTILSGTNTYLGNTSVASGGLLLNGSLTSNINVATGAIFGGNGSTTGTLTLAPGALFAFSPTSTLDVSGLVSLDVSFGVSSLVNADGSPIDWTIVGSGIYTLIGSTLTDFSTISNFGLANAADIGGGKVAYFQNGSLELVVVPEPSTYALFGAGAALGIALLRRRRNG